MLEEFERPREEFVYRFWGQGQLLTRCEVGLGGLG